MAMWCIQLCTRSTRYETEWIVQINFVYSSARDSVAELSEKKC